MQLSITFRHMDASDAVREYAREKVERIRKYFPDPIKGHVVFSCDRGYTHVADVQITLHNGIVIKGVEATEDMYSSIDLVMAKIERQVRRYKERIRNHKPSSGPLRLMRHRVVAMPEPPTAPAAETQAPAEPPGPRIIKEEKYIARPMSIEEAIMQLNLLHEPFLCFNNAQTHEVNVIYRRDDGSYGLIETHEEAPSGTEQAQAQA
ncbi:MAG: ribosome-associated translation inhibitor RaiA [Myxococcales bacterium]|nr:ribosome-associated translation inhibitor RaiA [Myxococcota bacterium]MDW8284041.1 ribosome-associated translation inhibitor RaiA [Myxococcales bacterium]